MLEFFRLSKGIELDRSVRILQGAGSPGVTGDTNTAQVGSFYLDTSGDAYIKQLSGAGTNKWFVYATEQFVIDQTTDSWRNPVEVVDLVAITPPTGTPGNPIIVDGESITDLQRVLFTAIIGGGGPNIYVYDQASATFSEVSNNETHADTLFIKRGTYPNRLFYYTGTDWQLNDDVHTNAIIVATDPSVGQFSSIKDAVDSITTNSSTNSFTVQIYPGIYTEDPITLKSFVSVEAIGDNTVIVQPTVSTNDVFIINGSNCRLSKVQIQGATGINAAAIRVISAPVPAVLDYVGISNCYEHIVVETTATPALVLLRFTRQNSGAETRRFFRVTSTAGQQTVLRNFIGLASEMNGTNFIEAAFVQGTGATFDANNLFVQSTTTIGDGIRINDGAIFTTTSGISVSGFNRNVFVENVGAAPILQTSNLTLLNGVTADLAVEHPGTTGFFNGVANRHFVFVTTGASLGLNYDSVATDDGSVLVGPLFLGATQNDITDVTDLIQQASPTGVLSGGVLSRTLNPLEVEISAGYGYLLDSVTLREKRVTWTTTLITVADNTQNYIYIDNGGTITFAGSIPNVIETILLGRARTAGGAIAFLSRIPLVANASATLLDEFLRKAIGSIFGTGSIVTENVTPLELDVTGGTYYYSKRTVNPSGGSAITFIKFFHTGGVQDQLTGQTVVDNANYDDLTNLTALTPGWYAKHSLYVAGEGSEETYAVVTAQAQYETLLEAEIADLPNPPVFFADLAVPIATLIIQEGNPNIVQIQDIRPRLGFTTPSISGGIQHGDLLGLSNDDHLQYLLVNGTRAMSGGLNMGGNSITNVNLVDGVDILAHAARHGANSSDPISTAAPIANLTPVSTNAVGIANTLSRSDHSHAITGFQTLDADLTALAAIATTGIYVITGSGTSTTRSILGTASRVSVSNGSGVAGNPTIDIDATYAGQTSIITLGTVTTGTWSATTIATTRGGTGLASIGTANQVLAVNTGATGLEYKTITAGAGITITPAAGSITIAAAGAFIQRFTFQADQLDSPGTANWAVNARAPASADTADAGLVVRRFDDTTEEGVGGAFTVPTGAVNVTIYIKSRAQTAPGATQTVQPTLYHRVVPDNTAVGAWSAALNLTTLSIPTNTNFQYDSQTISLATLGWTAGEFRQFELTRRGTQVGDTLTGDWDLLELVWEFTT